VNFRLPKQQAAAACRELGLAAAPSLRESVQRCCAALEIPTGWSEPTAPAQGC
jgi:hypothetical protein